MLCVGIGAVGMGLLMQIASLCFGNPRAWLLGWFLWLGGLHHREGKGEGDGDERYGQVSAHGEGGGRTHREGKRDEEEASKVRRGFSKENNHCDWAGMSVAIEPTSS